VARNPVLVVLLGRRLDDVLGDCCVVAVGVSEVSEVSEVEVVVVVVVVVVVRLVVVGVREVEVLVVITESTGWSGRLDWCAV
jgi:hypothetical protein